MSHTIEMSFSLFGERTRKMYAAYLKSRLQESLNDAINFITLYKRRFAEIVIVDDMLFDLNDVVEEFKQLSSMLSAANSVAEVRDISKRFQTKEAQLDALHYRLYASIH